MFDNKHLDPDEIECEVLITTIDKRPEIILNDLIEP